MDGFDDDFAPYEPDEEDTIVERYRNWPIYQDVGAEIYVTITGEEVYCTSIKDAKKEIDKAIKKWGRERGTAKAYKSR